MLLLPMLTLAPLKVTPELSLIVLPLVKPVPEMVTDVPTGPLVDDRMMRAVGHGDCLVGGRRVAGRVHCFDGEVVGGVGEVRTVQVGVTVAVHAGAPE